MNPQARNEEIVVQEVFEELVIYDLKRDKVHSLNPTAAFVWRHCDGQWSPAELAGLLQQELAVPEAEPLVWLTLDRLERAHLLEGKVMADHGSRTLTRREVLKMAGLTVALLPVVTTIVAPTAAQAQTGAFTKRIVVNANCNSDPNCANQCNALCIAAGCAGGIKNCTGSGSNTCRCCCTGCTTPGDACI